MRDLNGRAVLLTGAAGGIGSALARQLAGHGARLALVDLDAAGLDRLATELPGSTTHRMDLTDRAALAGLVPDVVAAHGGLDVLICNAGLTVFGRFADLAPTEIDAVLEVDLTSVLHLVALALPELRARDQAHVVLVSSMAGLQAFPFQSIYSAAKHGLRAYGESLRWELAAEGIGVSTVLPGTIATRFLDNAGTHDDELTGQLARLMRRYGTSPERVATKTVAAIRRNRGRVRVGWDCYAVGLVQWLAPPLLPALLQWGANRQAP